MSFPGTVFFEADTQQTSGALESAFRVWVSPCSNEALSDFMKPAAEILFVSESTGCLQPKKQGVYP